MVPREPWEEILFAQLQELPFESFEVQDEALHAYIPENLHHEHFLKEISLLKNQNVKITYSQHFIKAENWNTQWESNFQPIRVGEDCIVRADFHPSTGKQYELIINPKMSFGTGHHETTFMMLEYGLMISFEGFSVLDMGCGTGVLGILASKKGAKKVRAIDNDPWCVENALENAAINDCLNIQIELASSLEADPEEFDLIFANINRNVLIEQIPSYSKALKNDGILLISGFYQEDVDLLLEAASPYGFELLEEKNKSLWYALKCKK